MNFIKKQDRSILILEDNWKFIGENIYYKKNNSSKGNDGENEDKIKRQKEEIYKLRQFNSILNEIVEEKKEIIN